MRSMVVILSVGLWLVLNPGGGVAQAQQVVCIGYSGT